ncbi:MAG: translocation/assembly module TamB domain-containing protein [Myxococcales bacterium]|nr:MAG: translocation/assembly module TamB domain-containing protein [Myxococcales bacterium]
MAHMLCVHMQIRAWLRKTAISMAALFAFFLCLVLMALVFLKSSTGQDLVCSKLQAFANESLSGKVSIAKCSFDGLDTLKVQNLSLQTKDGYRALELEALTLNVDIAALLFGKIRLDEVLVEQPKLGLKKKKGEYEIQRALEARSSTPKEDNAPGPEIRITTLTLRHGYVFDAPQDFELVNINLQLSLSLTDGLHVGIANLALGVTKQKEIFLEGIQLEGNVHLNDNKKSTIQMRVIQGSSRLQLAGNFLWKKDLPTAIDATLEASVIPRDLHHFDSGKLSNILKSNLRLIADIDGSPKNLSLHARLLSRGGEISTTAHLIEKQLSFQFETASLDLKKIVQGSDATIALTMSGNYTLPDASKKPSRLNLKVKKARYKKWNLPRAEAELLLNDSAIRIRNFHLPEFEQGSDYFHASAVFRKNGLFEAKLQTRIENTQSDSALRKKWPGLDASLEANLSASMSEKKQLEASGEIAIDHLVFEKTKLKELHAQGKLKFGLKRGRVKQIDIKASLGEAHIAQGKLKRLNLDINTNKPGNYEVRASGTLGKEGRKVPLNASLSAQINQDESITANGNINIDGLVDGPLVIRLDNTRWHPQGKFQADEIQVRAAGIQASLRGYYSLRSESELSIDIDELNLQTLASIAKLETAISGTLRSSLRFSGRIQSPRIEGSVRLHDVSIAASPPFNIETQLLHDELNSLITVQASARPTFEKLVKHTDYQHVLRRPWQIQIQSPWRDLRKTPLQTTEDIRSRIQANFEGGEQSPAHGIIDAEFNWDDASGTEERCLEQARAALAINVQLKDNKTEINLQSKIQNQTFLSAQAKIKSDVDRWLQHGLPERLPKADITAKITALNLGQIPFICHHLKGSLNGHLDGRDVLGTHPEIQAQLSSTDLHLEDSNFLDLKLKLHLNAKKLSSEFSLSQERNSILNAEINGPLAGTLGKANLRLGSGAVQAKLALHKFPVALVSAVATSIEAGKGTVSGNLLASRAHNTAVDLRGELSFDRVSLVWLDPYFRLSDVGGRISVNPKAIRIHDLRTSSQNGRLLLNAQLDHKQWHPTTFNAELRTDKFPVRREGIMLATITSKIKAEGNLKSSPVVVNVVPEKLDIFLSERLGQKVQDLPQHKQVVYENQKGFQSSTAPIMQVKESEETSIYHGKSVVINVRTSTPFWVRRNDLAVQLLANIKLNQQNGTTLLKGPIEVRRGFIALLGKTFDFNSGEIVFAGASPINPKLDLKAVYRIPSGTKITVHIGGYLDTPQLRFTSDDPNVTTESQAIAQLVGTQRSSSEQAQSAGAQAQSALGGMVAGLIGTLAREEFGQSFPIISLDSGGNAESTRLRIGYQADNLLPKAWQNVIRGIYVEGSVSGGEREQSARAGFLLELFFPYDLLSSATYTQPDNWSLDLLWEP